MKFRRKKQKSEEKTPAEERKLIKTEGKKLSTGFPRLDQMFEGGLKLGTLNFVTGEISPTRDRFLSELAINEIKGRYGVVYVSTDRSGKEIENRIKIRLKVSKYVYQLYLNIIDTSSLKLERRFVPPIRYLMVPNDFTNVDGTIKESLSFLKEKRTKHQILIFDSLDGVLRYGRGDARDMMESVEKVIGRYSAIGFFAIDPTMHRPELVKPLIEFAASFVTIDASSNTITTVHDKKKITRRFMMNEFSFVIQ